MKHFKWDVLDHPSYNPNLAPDDFHPFTHMKKCLALQSFNDADRLQNAQDWLCGQAAKFYEGTCKLTKCYDECLNLNGNYVGKS